MARGTLSPGINAVAIDMRHRVNSGEQCGRQVRRAGKGCGRRKTFSSGPVDGKKLLEGGDCIHPLFLLSLFPSLSPSQQTLS